MDDQPNFVSSPFENDIHALKQLEQEEQFRLKHKDQPSLFDPPNKESKQ